MLSWRHLAQSAGAVILDVGKHMVAIGLKPSVNTKMSLTGFCPPLYLIYVIMIRGRQVSEGGKTKHVPEMEGG